jgi:hypothetical protein
MNAENERSAQSKFQDTIAERDQRAGVCPSPFICCSLRASTHTIGCH